MLRAAAGIVKRFKAGSITEEAAVVQTMAQKLPKLARIPSVHLGRILGLHSVQYVLYYVVSSCGLVCCTYCNHVLLLAGRSTAPVRSRKNRVASEVKHSCTCCSALGRFTVTSVSTARRAFAVSTAPRFAHALSCPVRYTNSPAFGPNLVVRVLRFWCVRPEPLLKTQHGRLEI